MFTAHRSTKFPSVAAAARRARWYLFIVASLAIVAACQSLGETTPAAPDTNSDQQARAAQDPLALPTAIPVIDAFAVPDAVPEDLATAWEVWSLLVDRHVDRQTFDRERFDEGAIRGIIAALGDIHTNYVPPEAFQIENADLRGSFQGIGARVELKPPDGRLFIVSPMEGSPAEKAGLRPGDLILKVDGESIQGLSIVEAVNKIRGPKGTAVTLLVRHLGAAEEVEITVIRGDIPLDSVYVRSRPEDRIGHIRVTTFYDDTPKDLDEAIRQVQRDGAEGLILDLRDNPGGLLGSVIDVVGMFLDGGLILYEVDGEGRRSDHAARGPGDFKDIPLVILANEGSASASEILAGALQDHDRAPVVGATTFGKGSVGQLQRLSNGGGLFITFAKWYTPNGRLIEGNGIEPDYEVTFRDRQKADTSQLEKAVEVMEELLADRSGGA